MFVRWFNKNKEKTVNMDGNAKITVMLQLKNKLKAGLEQAKQSCD